MAPQVKILGLNEALAIPETPSAPIRLPNIRLIGMSGGDGMSYDSATLIPDLTSA
jgi:hypothetical protein